MKFKEIKGRVMIEGRARGEALVSRMPFTFAHGVNPKTGIVTDPRSDIRGQKVKKMILIFPFTKGSTTAATWFLETVRKGNAPLAILNMKTEPTIVAGSILSKLLYNVTIPVMSEFEVDITRVVKNGDMVLVDGPAHRIVLE